MTTQLPTREEPAAPPLNPPTPLRERPTPLRPERAPDESETSPLQPAAEEQETSRLRPAAEERILDCFKLLDHRTRGRATSERMARRGPHLAFQDGQQTRLVALDDKVTHIGRGVSSDVRIEEHGVSRSHAIVVRYGRHARVLDNRSSNGTYVNGRRIVATNLTNGDVVTVGSVVMQYLEVR